MNQMTAIGGATAAIALSLVLAGCGSDSASDPDATDATDATTTTATAMTATTDAGMTQAKVAPRQWNASGPSPTIAAYIQENGFTEITVERGDPGAPNIQLPIPEGWEDAGH